MEISTADDQLLEHLRIQVSGIILKNPNILKEQRSVVELIADCQRIRDEYRPVENNRPLLEDQLDKSETIMAQLEEEYIQQRVFTEALEFWRQKSSVSDFTVEQRGIKVLINHHQQTAFGDTGAGQNVISDRRYRELGLEMYPNPISFLMGNSKRIHSPGTVRLPLAFEDDPTNIITVIAHVVHNFPYDLLLGNPFLQATKCLTSFKRRFVRCLSSAKSMWSFNLLGETTQRFQGQLGEDIPFIGLPDIESARNVMDADWAFKRDNGTDFKILTGSEQQLDWNIKYQDGRAASIEEWNLEYARRERYERSRNPNWQPDPSISLIEYKPRVPGSLNSRAMQRVELQTPALKTRPETEGTNTSSSFQSGGSLPGGSSDSSTSVQGGFSGGWVTDPYSSDSLVSSETAQWQAERPT